MFNYEYDPNDEDERFYEDTVYNEESYIEEENEKIRQLESDLKYEGLEEQYIREMREEGILRPSLVRPTESATKETQSSSSGEIPPKLLDIF